MKISIFKRVVLVLFASVVMFAGCKSDSDPDPDPEPNPINVKDYLVETGMMFSAQIDADDHLSTSQLFSYLMEKYEDYDTGVFENFLDDVQEQAEGGNGAPMRIVKTAMDLAGGSNGALKAGKSVTEFYVELAMLYGKFTAVDEDMSFEFDSSTDDCLEIVLYDKKSNPVVFKLKGSSKTTKARAKVTSKYKEYMEGELVDSDTDVDIYEVDIPQSISFTVTRDGNTIIDFSIMLSLAVDFEMEYEDITKFVYYEYWGMDKDYEMNIISVSLDFSTLNVSVAAKIDDYAVSASSKITKSGISLDNELKIGDTFMYSLKASLDGDLSDLDELFMDYYEDSGEDELIEEVQNRSFSADVSVNIMNRVRAEFSCDKISKLIDAGDDLEAELKVDNQSRSAIEKALNKLNLLYESGLYLDNSSKKSAYFSIDYFTDEDYDDYYVEPVFILTENEASYRFEEYFDNSDFDEVIESFEKIGEDFEDLFDKYFADFF